MFRTKLTLAFAAMLAFVLFLAGVLFWGASRSEYYLQRSQLAHYNLEAYLRLSDETFHHFKQLLDIILIDDQGTRIDVSLSRQSVDRALDRLRELTTAERDFVEEDEVESEEEELERIELIAREIDDAQTEFLAVIGLFESDGARQAWPRLTELLQTRIDGRFAELVDAAIEEEEDEVEAADREAQALLDGLEMVAGITAGASVLFVALAGLVLLRRLTAPMATLVDSTKRLAADSLDHRIEIPGTDEFSQLADSFNIMAARLQSKRRALLEARADLERKVEERTQELNTANAALRRTDTERRRFLADVSHELRTPLTVIRGEAEVTLRQSAAAADDYRAVLGQIVDQVGLLSRLVDDLLLMARAQAGVASLKLEAVDMSDLLAKVCRDAAALTGGRQIEIVPPSADGAAAVTGDLGRLTQLFFILVDNAIRYSGTQGRIEVTLTDRGAELSVAVSDSGPGIPAADLPHIFERFFRSEGARRLAPEGSGLGLPLAKAIVEAHHGTIAVDSTPDRGTIVTVTLPAAALSRRSA